MGAEAGLQRCDRLSTELSSREQQLQLVTDELTAFRDKGQHLLGQFRNLQTSYDAVGHQYDLVKEENARCNRKIHELKRELERQP